MQIILSSQTITVLRFQRHEDVFAQLLQYCTDQQVHAASFTAIGAVGEMTLAYYDLNKKTFEDHAIIENVEIVSLTGNIALFESKPVVHAHGLFSKRDLSTFGGHIKKIIVSATCELVLTILEGKMERQFDDETGLNLLH